MSLDAAFLTALLLSTLRQTAPLLLTASNERVQSREQPLHCRRDSGNMSVNGREQSEHGRIESLNWHQ